MPRPIHLVKQQQPVVWRDQELYSEELYLSLL